MKITPLDIQQQQFKGKMFGGLDPDEVDAFLQMVSQEFEGLIRENTDLKEHIRRNTQEMSDFAQRERDLRETMLAAQKITEEMKSNAQKEAALLVSEAELKGEKILAEVDTKLAQLRNEIQDLKRQKLQFETALKGLLDSHYKQLNLDGE